MKKAPVRMCIVCRGENPKKNMLRIVKSKDGAISFDFTGKAAGRGAYICDNRDCLTKCVKSRLLNKTFDMSVDEETYNKLIEAYDNWKN